MLTQDFILNGQGYGPTAELLAECGFDQGMLRPYYAEDGTPCVTVNTGRTKLNKKTGRLDPIYEQARIKDLRNSGMASPAVWNALMLRKDEWIQLDLTVLSAARRRLRAWSDLLASSTFTVPGMGVTRLEHETMSDPGEAIVDMENDTEGRSDAPVWQTEALPLPIIHSDFYIPQRRLAVSRRIGLAIDTVMAEAAGRRIGEMLEQITIGNVAGMTHGATPAGGRAPTVYGYTTFGPRIVYNTMTTPTGANGPAVLTSWLALRDLLYAQNMFGPFMVYTSNNWGQYLDNLFSAVEPSAGTLRSRLKQIDGIQDIRRLDYLASTPIFTVLMIQMTPETARAVVGMPITTVQWDERGGAQKNFRVMTIQAPQLRADYYDHCGIAHGTDA